MTLIIQKEKKSFQSQVQLTDRLKPQTNCANQLKILPYFILRFNLHLGDLKHD